MGLIITSARILPRFTMASRSSVWAPNGAARTTVGLALSSPDGRAAVGTKRCCPLAPAKVDTESHAKQRMATHMREGLFKNRPRFCHSRVADTGGRASYDPVIQRPDARSRYVARLQAVSSQN